MTDQDELERIVCDAGGGCTGMTAKASGAFRLSLIV